jgi:Fe-S-cluster-containing dehydrogenase component
VDKRIVLNLDYCIGCRSCEVACAVAWLYHRNLGTSSLGSEATLPFHCQHCDQPACVAACPNEAMVKGEDGLVRRRKFLCTGCGSCALACPFGVIDPKLVRRVVSKCNLCEDLVAQDRLPRCVAACPSGALTFKELSEITDEEGIGSRIVARQTWMIRR